MALENPPNMKSCGNPHQHPELFIQRVIPDFGTSPEFQAERKITFGGLNFFSSPTLWIYVSLYIYIRIYIFMHLEVRQRRQKSRVFVALWVEKEKRKEYIVYFFFCQQEVSLHMAIVCLSRIQTIFRILEEFSFPSIEMCCGSGKEIHRSLKAELNILDILWSVSSCMFKISTCCLEFYWNRKNTFVAKDEI